MGRAFSGLGSVRLLLRGPQRRHIWRLRINLLSKTLVRVVCNSHLSASLPSISLLYPKSFCFLNGSCRTGLLGADQGDTSLAALDGGLPPQQEGARVTVSAGDGEHAREYECMCGSTGVCARL